MEMKEWLAHWCSISDVDTAVLEDPQNDTDRSGEDNDLCVLAHLVQPIIY